MDPFVIAIGIVVSIAVFSIMLADSSGPRPKRTNTGISSRLDVYRPDFSQPATTEEKVAQLKAALVQWSAHPQRVPFAVQGL